MKPGIEQKALSVQRRRFLCLFGLVAGAGLALPGWAKRHAGKPLLSLKEADFYRKNDLSG